MATKKDTTYTKPVDDWLTQKQITMTLYPLGKKLNPWGEKPGQIGATWHLAQYRIVFERYKLTGPCFVNGTDGPAVPCGYSPGLCKAHEHKELEIPCFTQSKNGTDKGHKPTAYDALCCIQKYDPGSFSNFCSDFGYDEDSRKAESTYKAVVAEWEQVSNFFSSDELDQLQEIAQ